MKTRLTQITSQIWINFKVFDSKQEKQTEDVVIDIFVVFILKTCFLAHFCQRVSRAKTRGWRGGSSIEPMREVLYRRKNSRPTWETFASREDCRWFVRRSMAFKVSKNTSFICLCAFLNCVHEIMNIWSSYIWTAEWRNKCKEDPRSY